MINVIDLRKDSVPVEQLLNRTQFDYTDVNTAVEEIINTVKKEKDIALKRYSMQFDGVDLKNFRINEEALEKAFKIIDTSVLKDLKLALKNIKDYHLKQGFQPFEYTRDDGVILGQKVTPIDTIGLYIPGGTASYPSTVLMNAVPAKIAGVKKLVMITPPEKSGGIKPSILVAAKLAGVDEIYALGGAHGIAALAYGTESVPKVDKIVGPGNIYVSMAKKHVSGDVGIDMIAGPSEILILADETSNPDYIAADLMGQAEHDVLASATLLSTSETVAIKVQASLVKQLPKLSRKTIIETALKTLGKIVITRNLEESIALANKIAPEHLEILVSDPFSTLKAIQHAGSIFIGPYTPEPMGDYLAGPNHTLPTSGTARFSSPLSTEDFQKKSAYLFYPKDAFKRVASSVINLAHEESLTAHANAVDIRLSKDDDDVT